jgi:hypothetical protein
MGKLYPRNGVLYADYYDRDGIRQRRSTRTADKVVARARLRDFELQTTDRGAHETEELADALDYFTDVACAGSSGGTVSCYKQKAAHLNRLIGTELLDKLTRETVERYIANRLEEGAHRHSVHKELVVLRGALKSAKPRGKFHGSLEVVPEFDSGYVPRTTYLTPEQFLELVPHLVRPRRSRSRRRRSPSRERRVQRRAFYCLLIAYASPRRGEVEKRSNGRTSTSRAASSRSRRARRSAPGRDPSRARAVARRVRRARRLEGRSSSPGRTSAATSPPRASAPACRA